MQHPFVRPRIQLLALGVVLTLASVGSGLIKAKDDAKQDKNASSQKTDQKAVSEQKADSQKSQKSDTQKADAPKTDAAGSPKPDKQDIPQGEVKTETRKRDLSADEKQIVESGESFVKAFGNGDVDAIMKLFAENAEFIDEQGNRFTGREEIEKVFKNSMENNKDAKMDLLIESIRVVSPGVALEDGITLISNSRGQEPDYTRYSAVHVKSGDKWLVASVREQAPEDRREHRSNLRQLSWLLGEWVDEGEGSMVIFSGTVVDGGHFLQRKFTVRVGGHEALTGTQRIGWDPLARKLRAWTFDSDGGISEGFWYRDDDRWILKSIGVTADGKPASSTSIYTVVDENHITWQSVNHEIGGWQLPDGEPITLVRRSPAPESTDEAISKSK